MKNMSAHHSAKASHGHPGGHGHGKGPKLPPPYHLSEKAKPTLVASFVLAWVAVAAMGMTVVSFGQVVDVLLAGIQGARWVGLSGEQVLNVPGLRGLFLWPVVVMISLRVRAVVVSRGMIREENLVRHRVVDAVFEKGAAAQSSTRGGSVVSLATESAEKMMRLRQSFLGQVVASLSSPLLVVALIVIFVDWVSGLILLAFIPMVPLLVWLFRKIVSKVSTGSQDARKDLAAAYMDALQSLTSLRLLGAGERIGDDLEAVGERNRVAIMKLLKSNQLILFVMDAAFSLALVTVAAALALWRLSAGALTPGEAVALVGLSILLLEPMDQVGAFFYEGMGGLGAQRGIYGFLRGAKGAHTATVKQADGCAVDMDDVHFAYGEAEVLRGASLRVGLGERVALVGPSGQGKSTLLGVIRGDLAPQSGTVAVSETPATVAQTTWLFSGTIADNLRVAKEDATEDEMWAALERARLAEEVRRMPDGLDTELGERGLGLSGGQAQRLSLARALVSGRKLLLLDEPTSHVDLGSEREILAAIEGIGPEYTLIMVTHRASSLAHMDRVLTVREGRVEEEVQI